MINHSYWGYHLFFLTERRLLVGDSESALRYRAALHLWSPPAEHGGGHALWRGAGWINDHREMKINPMKY